MATYFHGVPEIQGDRLQTLYLMNPSYVGYTDAPAQANMGFFDSPDPQQQSEQHLVGVPIEPPTTADVSAIHQGLSPGHHYTPVRPPRGLSLSLSQRRAVFAVTGSKYLKATQQLLDELVSVGKDEPTGKRKYGKSSTKGDKDGGDVELTAAERHELQMNKAKLVNMLDQVEQRYRQYQHQMQILVSSFEAAAGFGSARSYTALALRTMSKQFRCLRDAISSQIRRAGRSLGENYCVAGVGPRLRYADHQLRQQRALQQLGVMHDNAWRPQRGLPERAVSVLRAWLFEHFLHPYPKDCDKHMLARETGLTRSQVSNWFINARVRLWKPMIEEMYLEESKEQEHDDNTDERTRKSDDSEQSNHVQSPRPNQDASPIAFENRNDESFVRQHRLKMKFMDHGCEFGAYQMRGIGRFDYEEFAPRYGGNGVSLTLGLPHCEGIAMGKRLDMASVENNYFSINSSNGSCYQTM